MLRNIFKSKLMIALIPAIVGALTGYLYSQSNIQVQKDIAKHQNETSITISNNQSKAAQDNWEKQYQITVTQTKFKEHETDFNNLKQTFAHMNNLRAWYFDNYLSILLARLQFNDIPLSDRQYFLNEVSRIQNTTDSIHNQLNNDISILDNLVNKTAEYYDNPKIHSAKNDFLNNLYSSTFIMGIDESEIASFYNNQLLKTSNHGTAYNLTRNEYYRRFQEHTELVDSFQKFNQVIQEEKSKLIQNN